MKKLITPAGLFGPYQSVTTLGDRYRGDDTDLPFTVVGTGTIEDAVAADFPDLPAVIAQARQAKRQQLRDELKAKLYQNLDVDDYVALLVMQIVPAPVKTRVEAIKAAYDTAISAVNAAGTEAAVLAVTASWPT